MSQAEIQPGTVEDAQRLQNGGRWAEALAILEPLAQQRLTVNIAFSMGCSLFELGRYGPAEHWLGLAARHRPGEPAVRQRLGNLYAAQGRIGLAELELRTALAFKPDHIPSQISLAGLLLSVGRYAEGWPLLDGRARLHPDVVPEVNPSFPEWRGEPLAGKSILVWVEQGFGDQIQMARFANLMKAQGASCVTMACRPPLAALFATLEGADAVLPVALNTQVSVTRHDYWSRYFSLPGRLGTTLETLPTAPYLSAPAERRERWRDVRGVGLSWQASPTGFNAGAKGLPPELARELLDLGVMSLHPEDSGATDFADTAAIIERLDLVISIDTSVAHLAGAMGKACWTMVPYVHSDWRWLRGRADSPWYPSMRLHRQAAPGDWRPVVEQVKADLKAFRS